MKKNKGITLIALVVTVIVLLIIAGISISTLKGDRGLIKLTKQAKVDTENANNAEKLEIERIFNELEYGEDLTDEELKEKKDEIIDSLNEQVKGLENQVKELEQKNGELEDNNSDLSKQVESLGVDIENVKEQIKGLNGQVEDLKTEVADLKDQITKKDKEIEDLNGQIAGKDKEIEAKNKEIADLKKQVQEKQNKIDDLQGQINDINSILGGTTAEEGQILAGYKAYSKGRLLTGTMKNNGALNTTLNAGGKYTIPAGYTTGGTVTAKDLKSQTTGTAEAGNIISGKTAWVNGASITGTMKNNGALNTTLNAGGKYTIPAGYTTGGTVTAKDLKSQTSGTATAADIAKDKTAWVNGVQIKGTQVLNNAEIVTASGNCSNFGNVNTYGYTRSVAISAPATRNGKKLIDYAIKSIYIYNSNGAFANGTFQTLLSGGTLYIYSADCKWNSGGTAVNATVILIYN